MWTKARATGVVLVAALVAIGAPIGTRPVWADDDFFGEDFEAFTGLRREDVEEIDDEGLDEMRGGTYFGVRVDLRTTLFDPDSGELVIDKGYTVDAIDPNGGAVLTDTRTGDRFDVRTNSIVDSFDGLSGLAQVVQISGNQNVVNQEVKVDLSLFFGTVGDANFAAFQAHVLRNR